MGRRARVLLTPADLRRLPVNPTITGETDVVAWAHIAFDAWGFMGVGDRVDGSVTSFLLLTPAAALPADHPAVGRIAPEPRTAAVVALHVADTASRRAGRTLLESGAAHLRRAQPSLRRLEAVADVRSIDERVLEKSVAEATGFTALSTPAPQLVRLNLDATVRARMIAGLRRRARAMLTHPLPRPQTGLPSASKVTSVG